MCAAIYMFLYGQRDVHLLIILPLFAAKNVHICNIQLQKFYTFFGQRSKNCIAELKKKIVGTLYSCLEKANWYSKGYWINQNTEDNM